MEAISTTVGQYSISYALGYIYIAGNSGFVVTEPCEAPRDVGHLVYLASKICLDKARAFMSIYETIASK